LLRANAAIVDSQKYRKKLTERAEKGELAPAVECMLWHYAKGKPVDRVQVDSTVAMAEEIAGLSDEQLRDRLRALAEEMEH
jgi:hypothetical protein